MKELEKDLLDSKYKKWEILLSQYRDWLYELEKKYFPDKLLNLKEKQDELIEFSDIKLKTIIENNIFPFNDLPKENILTPLW